MFVELLPDSIVKYLDPCAEGQERLPTDQKLYETNCVVSLLKQLPGMPKDHNLWTKYRRIAGLSRERWLDYEQVLRLYAAVYLRIKDKGELDNLIITPRSLIGLRLSAVIVSHTTGYPMRLSAPDHCEYSDLCNLIFSLTGVYASRRQIERWGRESGFNQRTRKCACDKVIYFRDEIYRIAAIGARYRDIKASRNTPPGKPPIDKSLPENQIGTVDDYVEMIRASIA